MADDLQPEQLPADPPHPEQLPAPEAQAQTAHGIPYPVPTDAVSTYPAKGQALADTIERVGIGAIGGEWTSPNLNVANGVAVNVPPSTNVYERDPDGRIAYDATGGGGLRIANANEVWLFSLRCNWAVNNAGNRVIAFWINAAEASRVVQPGGDTVGQIGQMVAIPPAAALIQFVLYQASGAAIAVSNVVIEAWRLGFAM